MGFMYVSGRPLCECCGLKTAKVVRCPFDCCDPSARCAGCKKTAEPITHEHCAARAAAAEAENKARLLSLGLEEVKIGNLWTTRPIARTQSTAAP